MKKLLFQKFLKDTFNFFTLIGLTIALIVWVIQAVGFLDFVTEDGHGLKVYFFYTLLNFPKILHRVLPFVFFISLFYQISKYENNNELLIFWTNGISKLQFINMIMIYSTLILLFQILLGGYLSPKTQNEARSYIRNSNTNFFPSLIKEGVFIDAVSNLTIFIESKDETGFYNNIFLKEDINKSKEGNKSKSQTIYAKKGTLIDEDQNRYFQLFDGKIINNDFGKITNFTFEKIDFNLSKYDSKTTTYPKIQEASSIDLFNCLNFYLKNKINKFKAQYLRCETSSIANIKQEFLKRFYKPIYIPLLALVSCFLILRSKEHKHYDKFKFNTFILIFLLVVVSEISLRYSAESNLGFLFFIGFPILSLFAVYFLLITKLKDKI